MRETTAFFMKRPIAQRMKMLNTFKNARKEYIPVIIHTEKDIESLSSCKYSVHEDANVHTLITTVRKSLPDILSTDAIYLLTDGNVEGSVLLSGSLLVREAWDSYPHKEDGFLHIKVCKENTFGESNK